MTTDLIVHHSELYLAIRKSLTQSLLISAGATERRGSDAVSGQEAVFRRIQVSEMQAQVDVGQQLG